MKKRLLSRINELYKNNGINIIDYLKKLDSRSENSIEDILISYDFQAGTYVEKYRKNPTYVDAYLDRLVQIIDELQCYKRSIFECGVGEATILVPLLNNLKTRFAFSGGADISWSRTKIAQLFTEEYLHKDIEFPNLVMGDMFSLPLKDNSIDIVFTRQAIEPNGGHEKEILQELYRITNEYLILIEPAYDLAGEEERRYMEKHGYITMLYEAAKQLGYHIITWELYGMSENPLNPVGIMIIKKEANRPFENPWCCPITKSELKKCEQTFFSEESLLAYPIVNGVPCLLSEYAVIATKMNELMES